MTLQRLLIASTLVVSLAGCPEKGASHTPGDGHDHGTAPVHSEDDGHGHGAHKDGDGHDHDKH